MSAISLLSKCKLGRCVCFWLFLLTLSSCRCVFCSESTDTDEQASVAALRQVIAGQTQKPTKVAFDHENMMHVDGRPFVPIFSG